MSALDTVLAGLQSNGCSPHQANQGHPGALDHLEAEFGGSEPMAIARTVEPPMMPTIGQWGRFLTVGQLFQDTASEPDWLWHGVVVVGGACLLCAKPKVGKSTFLRQFALCVARGEPFLGRPTRQGKVLYLAIEETPNIFGPECRRVGWTEEDPIVLRFGSVPIGQHRQIVGELQALVKEGGYSLLVVDTIGRMARVRSGNDYAEVSAALEPVIDLARETGCAVVMTHHLGKNDRETGDGSIGSTAYFAAVDVSIDLKKLNGNRVIDSVGRYGKPFEQQVLEFDPDTRRLSLGCSLEAMQADDAQDRLVDLVAVHGPLSRDTLKSLAKMSATRFNDALATCKEDQRIEVLSGRGKKGDPHVLAVPKTSGEDGSDSGSGFSSLCAEHESESAMELERRTLVKRVVHGENGDARPSTTPGTWDGAVSESGLGFSALGVEHESESAKGPEQRCLVHAGQQVNQELDEGEEY